MSARTRLFAGPVHGPTHRSAPTESIEIPVNPRRAGGDRAPPLPVDRGARRRAYVPKAWLPPTKFRAEIWGVSHGHRPLRKGRKAAATTRASGAERSVCGADGRKGWGSWQKSSPKCPATLDNPSVALRATAPFAQGCLALRGTGERADTRVRPYVVIGIASSARRGGTEPAPYGSTGSAGLRADVPKAWPLPPKFRSEIWGVGHRHRPLRKDGNPDLLVPRGAATSPPL